MTRKEFTSNCSTWGYPQYVRRTEIFGDRAIAKANVSLMEWVSVPSVTDYLDVERRQDYMHYDPFPRANPLTAHRGTYVSTRVPRDHRHHGRSLR